MSEVISEGLKELREFLKYELSDYGFEWKIETDDDSEDSYWYVEIWQDGRVRNKRTVKIKHCDYMCREGDKPIKALFIQNGEDNWLVMKSYDWNVKHFWIALLNWPF